MAKRMRGAEQFREYITAGWSTPDVVF